MQSGSMVAMGGNALVVSDPAAIAAAEAAKARIQAAYIMAMQRPRNEDDARVRILAACRRPEFASRAEFAKPIGKDKVRGPSIRLAELALRTWGNIDSDIQVVYEDDNVRRTKIRALDLETNATFGKEITVKKTIERRSKKDRDNDVVGERKNSYGDTVFILRATDDELMVKENAIISKVLRNEGLRLIPGDIIDEAIAVARETMRNRDSKDPAAARKTIMDAFAEIGIRPAELQKYLKHPVDTLSPAELEDLRTIYRAIKDGDATWRDYIEAADQSPGDDDKAAAQQAAAAIDEKFKAVFAAEIADPMFSKFIAETAKTYNTGVETVRADMLNQVEAVKAGFAQWRARYQKPAAAPGQPASTPEADTDNNEPDSGKSATNGVTPADAKPAANGTAAGPSKEDAFRSEWINLKPQGFGKYVERNVERFKAAPPWVRDEALAKWKKFYAGYPCPIGQTSTETAAEMAAEMEGEAQGQEIAPPADTQQAPQPDRQPSAAADVQRLKIIEEIKRYPEAVTMEAKRRMGLSIMPSAWPPSLEGAGRLFDMVQAVAGEKGKGPQ